MIQLPADFDVSALFTDLFTLAAPFVGIAFAVACGFLIANILKNAPR